MNTVSYILLASFLVQFRIGVIGVVITKDQNFGNDWMEYKRHYGLSFSFQEEIRRSAIFMRNLHMIRSNNRENGPVTLKMNQFGHLEPNELPKCFRKDLAEKVPIDAPRSDASMSFSERQIPESMDWRLLKAVTRVKDQKRCGSCYAFSATDAIESANAIKNGSLYELSVQLVVDCSSDFGNQGCNGGLMDNVFKFAMVHGMVSESSYPYVGMAEQCSMNNKTVLLKVKGIHDVSDGDEKELTRLIAFAGPVSVAIDASHLSFQFYHSGVYSESRCSSSELDHGVLAVGYGGPPGDPYYIVKNSWGSYWGEDGFIKMARNKNNSCGIATSASIPIL